ncbi:MAG: M48 family metallopeptidase, partial [Burkholderiales bacterium]|nr:M48 family metallopeptidase [Burkholderiales bacterium]
MNVRFSRDVQIPGATSSGSLNTVKDHYLLNNFLIDEFSSPYIDTIVNEVCGRVGMPRENIHLFVSPSPDFQASCYAVSDDDCLISLSSALVDLLDAEELKFVVGHELGHYLFKHYLMSDAVEDSIEYLSVRRAQEISCDRIGLMSCEDLSHATSAIIKTTSGLKTEYLRLNVGQFIDQLSKLSSPASTGEYKSTHPTFLIRCRALLWFSTSIDYSGDSDTLNSKDLDIINSRVDADLDKFIDGPMNK